jgi:hypothetical protein
MTQLIRKQFYINRKQAALIKHLARTRKISEAEVVRQAIEQQSSGKVVRSFQPDPAAWEKAAQLMKTLHDLGPLPNQTRDWTRNDLYKERLSRYDRHTH